MWGHVDFIWGWGGALTESDVLVDLQRGWGMSHVDSSRRNFKTAGQYSQRPEAEMYRAGLENSKEAGPSGLSKEKGWESLGT